MLRIIIFLKTFLFLLNENLFLDDLVNIDYSKVEMRLEDNEQKKSEYKNEYRKSLHKDRRLFCRKLWISFLWILSAVILDTVILFISQDKSIGLNKSIGVLSLFCFSWATLGRLGWEGQTFAGNTVFEKLDSDLFWILYFLGTLFGTISIAVG